VPDRGGRQPRQDKGDRPRAAGTQPIENAVPLVKRAIKVLADREVSPQLGLLKSTMLQLDSTFSERTYGASSFRDFAEKLASTGAVTLKESGRNILVELKEDGRVSAPASGAAPEEPRPQSAPQPPAQPASSAPRVADAVTEVRRLFQNAQQPPRWPMYVRQVKQYLRGVDPSFDERKFGFQSLNDLLRACQKDGLFRMERDRQGVIRFFQGNVMKETEGRSLGSIDAADIAAAERLAAQAEAEMLAAEQRESEIVDGDVVREVEAPSIVDAEEAAPAAEAQATEGAPGAEEERPSGRTPRRKGGGRAGRAPKEPKAAKEPREKKSVTKPRGGRKKVAVAADA
jgi:hypothetical protein